LAFNSQARTEFFAGLRNVTPMVIGAFPFGVLFGVVALTARFSFWVTVAFSLLVFAGASQFAAVALLTQGAAYPLVVLTVFIVNLRHAFYGASVAQYLRGLPKTWQRVLASTTTDESYAVTIVHYRDAGQGDAAYKHWYFLGANLGLFFMWQGATVLGYFIGQLIGDPLALGLDFTLPLIFIAVLIPRLKSRATIVSALVAGSIAVLGFALPSKLGLLIAMGAGIAAGFAVEKWVTQN
jgi:4-azaleucine resistance transporter AzlC